MGQKSFFSQLIARLTSETPIFFKKIVIFGMSLGVTGGAILGVGATPVPIPHILTVLAGYMVTVGLVCTAVAKSATTNPDLQAQGGSNVVVNAEETPPVSTTATESPVIPQV
jgi:hypothetical protein